MFTRAFVASGLTLHSFAVVVAIANFNHTISTSAICQFSFQFLFPGHMRHETFNIHFLSLPFPMLAEKRLGEASLS